MQKPVEVEGVILAILSNAVFRVELADRNQILARASETIRRHFVRIVPGDRVKMEMPSSGLGTARIVLRPGED
jgi:translation initiation factor IF-1